MYKIEAIIRTHLFDAVQDALHDVNVIGLTASDCRGVGRQKGVTHSFRGSQYSGGTSPRLRLEVVVTSEQLEDAVNAIQKAATTGEVGDGKIFITKLEDIVRIRTNEHGESALS